MKIEKIANFLPFPSLPTPDIRNSDREKKDRTKRKQPRTSSDGSARPPAEHNIIQSSTLFYT